MINAVNNTIDIEGYIYDITKNKLAQETLKLSEERYRTIFDNFPISITQIDKNGIIIDVNEYHINSIGKKKVTKNDFLNKNILSRNSIINAGLVDQYKSLLKGKTFELTEVYFPETTGGLPAYLNIKGVPLFENSEPNGAIITIESVTEKVLAKKSAKQSEQRLNIALKGARIGYWDYHFNSDYTYRSKEWFEMLGYKKENFAENSETWKKIIHPDDIDFVEQEISKHYNNEIPELKVEHRLKTKSGNYKWILDWGTIIERDKNGLPLRAAGIHLDINTSKLSEILLRESEEKYSALIEQANEGIIINQDWKLVYLNKYASDLLGYRNEEMLNFSIDKYFLKKDLAKVKSKFKKRISGIATPHIYEILIITKNNIKVPIEVNAKVMQYKGKPAVQIIFRDITERKQAELEKIKKQQELDLIFNSTSDYMALTKVEQNDFRLMSFNKAYWKFIKWKNPKLSKDSLNLITINKLKETLTWSYKSYNNLLKIYNTVVSKKIVVEQIENELSPNGKVIFESKYIPVLDKKGNCSHILFISKDITEQHKTEIRNQYLAKMLDASPISYIVADTNGLITDLNPALEKMTGYKREELIGKSPIIFNAETNARQIQNEIIDTIVKKEIWTKEFLNKKKNGENFYVSSTIFPMLNNSGKATTYVGFNLDITEKKEMERVVNENEENLRVILNASTDVIILISNEGKIIEVNEKLENVIGVKREKLIGSVIYNLFRGKIKNSRKEVIKTMLDKKQKITFKDKSHKRVWDNSLLPIINKLGEVKRIAIFSKDITDKSNFEK